MFSRDPADGYPGEAPAQATPSKIMRVSGQHLGLRVLSAG